MKDNNKMLEQLTRLALGMDLDTLKVARDIIGNCIDSKRKEVGMVVKSKLFPGLIVKVNHHKLAGKECEVVEVKRSKAIIRVVGGSKYDVPLSLIVA